MDNFVYYTPTKVFFGKGVEKNIGDIVAEYGYSRVLLHFGGGSVKKSGLLDCVKQALTAKQISYIEFGGVEANPKIGLVREGVELCKKENIDLILAVGGGSVIDSAKSISMGLANDVDPWDIIIGKAVPTKSFPLGVILTLAAAGSEMSDSHVISDPEAQLKRGCNTNLVRPLFAVMNPELTYTVSRFQTGCGVVDIMMHTLERYFTPVKYAEPTDRIAEGLLLSVMEAGKKALANPVDYEARAALMWASSLSHNELTGCGKSKMFTVHKLEHDVSGVFDNVAHGAGLSVLFPAWAKYVYKENLPKFKRFAINVMGIADEGDDEVLAVKGIEALKAFFKSLDMPVSMGELGVQPSDYEKIADKTTNNGAAQVKGAPMLGKADILKIYQLAE